MVQYADEQMRAIMQEFGEDIKREFNDINASNMETRRTAIRTSGRTVEKISSVELEKLKEELEK